MIAEKLARKFGRSEVAQGKEIRRARALVTQIAVLAMEDIVVRDWVPQLIAPLEAAVHISDVDGTLQDAIYAKSAADAAENHLLVAVAQCPTVIGCHRLLSALSQEEKRIHDLKAKIQQALLSGEISHAH